MNYFTDILELYIKEDIMSKKIVIWGNSHLGREIALHCIRSFQRVPECFLDKKANSEFTFPAWVCGHEIPIIHPDEFDFGLSNYLLISGANDEKTTDEMQLFVRGKSDEAPNILKFSELLTTYDQIDVNELFNDYERFYGRLSDEETAGVVFQRCAQLREMDRSGLLLLEDIRGKRILDWECGNGTFSRLFSLLGASEVVGCDTLYRVEGIPVKPDEAVKFIRCPVEDLPYDDFDLIFSNTVTEHMQNLPSAFGTCYKKLKAGGKFFTTHDNYYSPLGSHDHNLLSLRGSTVVGAGPMCYKTEGGCDCTVSNSYRLQLRKLLHYKNALWDKQLMYDMGTTTDNHSSGTVCRQCWYYKRSRPWGHLIYQSDFTKIYPHSFQTGNVDSFLNKVAPFQLLQYIVEAGFLVDDIWKSYYYNQIPPELRNSYRYPMSKEDLLTWVVRVRAKKPMFSEC